MGYYYRRGAASLHVHVRVPECSTVARLEGELNDIEALKELKIELISQKEVGVYQKFY